MVPVYIIVFRLFTRPIRARTLDVRYQLDQVFAHLKQKIDGIQVVQATAREAGEIAAFTEKITALHRPRVHVNHLGIAFSNLCVGVGGIGSAVVFAVGAYEVAGGSLTTGELIAISALAGLIFTPITRLSELAASYQQAATSLTRLGEILDFPLTDRPQFKSIDEKTVPAGVCGRIEFDRVSFHYLPDRPVLYDISLCIESGRKVAIVGPTGSGKTTLMNLLLRFYEPTSGEVRIDGRSLDDYSVRDLRRHLGVVPQEPVIFRGTLAENICYGTPDATPAEIKAAARAALVHDLADSLAQQYGTLVGEGGHPLSQGERQRIAIARLFCKSPSIVVLDEATSALDRASETLIQEALDRLLSGRTTFVIAHRLATVLTADQIIVMDQGRIVQMGRHAELLADENGLYRKLYECQFGAAGEPQRPGPLDPNPRDAAEQPVVLEPVCA